MPGGFLRLGLAALLAVSSCSRPAETPAEEADQGALGARPAARSALPLAEPPAEGAWMRLAIRNTTVHNSHYLATTFLYQLQTLLAHDSPDVKVTDPAVVRRLGREMFLNLDRRPPSMRILLEEIAAGEDPPEVMHLSEMQSYMRDNYARLTNPYPTLSELLGDHPYRDNPEWLRVPVDSATFHHRRVLHISKDRIADALIAYFDNRDRLIYPEGTVIVAESLDKQGEFLEAEVMRKRADTFWNFAVYDHGGRLVGKALAFDEEGDVLPASEKGFETPQSCAMCHRIDRLDLSGDPEAPVRSPIRAFFHRLPARVPEIHLGPEYYSHMAFTELTEANGKVKDGVFGVYGSLLLSELAGRKRLGELSKSGRERYLRLRPYYPELLGPLDRLDSFTNSAGMRFVRIPAPGSGDRIGSLRSDPDRQDGEQRREAGFRRSFFLGMYEVTNAEFRRFRPGRHSPPFRGAALDQHDRPAVSVVYAEAQAFVDWLNALPEEQRLGRRYRLPSEDEWEWAARGGDDRRFPWGDRWPPPPGSGNFADEASGERFRWERLQGYRDSHPATAPVGSFFPNPYFLYDMAGNAYEWTRAVRRSGFKTPQPVLKGSSWGDELPKVLRCAFRLPRNPETRWAFVGLRVAADVSEDR